jgi:hypothetical protein
VLLLDEMLPPALAEQLSDAGCDTLAVSADPGLRGAPDAEVLERAALQGRVLVTDNIRDFVPLHNEWAAAGRTHPGLLLVHSKTFPMTKDRTGKLAAALLARKESDRWPAAGQYDFLQPAKAVS